MALLPPPPFVARRQCGSETLGLNGAVIRAVRVYELSDQDSGARWLVDRIWPRGIAKASLALAGWARDAAPSDELRRWFGHDPRRWEEFRRRTRANSTGPGNRGGHSSTPPAPVTCSCCTPPATPSTTTLSHFVTTCSSGWSRALPTRNPRRNPPRVRAPVRRSNWALPTNPW
jgi:hypothetical protein